MTPRSIFQGSESMKVRYGAFLGLALAVLPAGPLRADDSKPAEPAVIIRLKSFDGLLGDFKFLAEVAGKAEEAKQIDGIVQHLPIKNGLAGTGLDTKRPFYMYAVATPDGVSSYACVLAPIADEAAFVSFLEDTLGNFGVTAKKGDDDIYAVGLPNLPFEAYFKFADKYVYVTARDREPLQDGRRMSVEQLAAKNPASVASATIRLDHVPDMLKQMALSQFEVHTADAKEHKPARETPAQSKLRLAVIDFASKQIRMLVRDGQALDLDLTVDRATQDLGFEANLTGKPGTALAKDISALAERASVFASSLSPAANVSVNLSIPKELREVLVGAIKEGFEEGIKHEKDEHKREVAKKAIEVLLPIVQAGQIDANFAVRGNTAGQYTFAFGMRVPDSKAIEQLVKEDIVPTIPEKERKLLSLEHGKIGGFSALRLVPPSRDAISPEERKIYGDSPSALVAFPNNRVVVGFGADPEAALKSVLEPGSSKPAPPIAASVSILKLAPLTNPRKAETLERAAKEAFGKAPTGSDLITFSVQGGPSLKVKWSAKALGITFFTKVQELDR
jgi:hypothetical protein